MSSRRHASRYMAVLTAAGVLFAAGCGSSHQHDVAVRIAGEQISAASVKHWTAVMAAGRPSSSLRDQKALRRQALQFLIASNWLVLQAAKEHLTVPERQVQQHLEEYQRSEFPGGSSEYSEYLAVAGLTPVDAALQTRTQLIAAKLRQHLLSELPPITSAQVTRYYEQHLQEFAIPERRITYVATRKTKREIDQIKAKVLAGGSMLTAAQERVHEGIVTFSAPKATRNAFENAVFAGHLKALEGPARKGVDFLLFKIKQILPAGHQPLVQAYSHIHQLLIRQQRQQALTSYRNGLTQHWKRETACQPQYDSPYCRQSTQPPPNPLKTA